MNIKSAGLTAFLWDFVGKIISKFFNFFVFIIFARLLTPQDFGLMALIMVIVGLANIFIDVGLGSAIIQRKRLLEIHYNSVFYFNVLVGFVLSLFFYLFAANIAKFYNYPQLDNLIKTVSVLFLIEAFISLQVVILKKELNYKLLSKINVISVFISGIMGIIFAYLHYGIWSMIIQVVSYRTVYAILIWIYSKWKPNLMFSFKALKQLWGFGFRIFLTRILDTLYIRLDVMIIGKIFPINILGYFQNAKRLKDMTIGFAFTSLSEILFPVFSKIHKKEEFNYTVLKMLNIILFVTFILIGSIFVSSKDIIQLLFTSKWLNAVHFFDILILSSFAYPVSILFVNVLSSRGKAKILLKLEIYKKLVGLLGFGFLYLYGINVFLFYLIVQAIINGIFLNVYYVAEELKINLKKFIKPIFIQLFLFLISLAIFLIFKFNIDNLIGNIVIHTILYIFIFVFLNFLFKTETFKIVLIEINFLIKRHN